MFRCHYFIAVTANVWSVDIVLSPINPVWGLMTVAVFLLPGLLVIYIFWGLLWPDVSEVMEVDVFSDTLPSQLVQCCRTGEDSGRLDDTRCQEKPMSVYSPYNLSPLKHFGDSSSHRLSPQEAIVNESLIGFSHEWEITSLVHDLEIRHAVVLSWA